MNVNINICIYKSKFGSFVHFLVDHISQSSAEDGTAHFTEMPASKVLLS
jgi:hypothetical protein